MGKNKIYSIITIIFFINFFGHGQIDVDSLKYKNYETLLSIFNTETDSLKRKHSAEAWIIKAKKENNRKKLVIGYYNYSQLFDDATILKYCDSILNLTVENSFGSFPMLAYLSKAYFYHEKGNFERAIDNYLMANKHAEKLDNTDMIIRTNYSIGTIKRKIGQYEEALTLYRQNLSYAKKYLVDKNKSGHYLNTLIAMSNVFYEQKSVDSSSYYNELGIVESKRYNNESAFHHFNINESIVSYLKGNYNSAIDSIKNHFQYFINVNDRKNLSYCHFYLGKSYAALDKNTFAVDNFKKVDSIFQIETDLSIHTRESYEFLINYFKGEHDLESQLFYIDRLMKFDSIVNKDKLYLNKNIFKEYDIPNLISEKKSILKEMKLKDGQFTKIAFFISSILLILIGALVFQYRKRKIYKSRFEEVISKSVPVVIKSDKSSIDKVNIPDDIVKDLLSKLEIFENNQKFTSNEISLNYLSKKLNTNSNYLSKIINHYKETSFSNYINNLRIEYIITQLKSNPTLRKYTIKAIAQEIGFNNSESFSKAFYKETGIKPSYFIKELEKVD